MWGVRSVVPRLRGECDRQRFVDYRDERSLQSRDSEGAHLAEAGLTESPKTATGKLPLWRTAGPQSVLEDGEARIACG